MKSAFAQRQIPTLLGIGVLIASLVGGVFAMQYGEISVFAPRATAQTTPKNMKVTNVKDTSFTVSFITDDSTAGFVKYGKIATDLKTQAGDDRDQLAGSVQQFTSHYVTVRDLDADTEYNFTLGTGSVPKFDNDGVPFKIKTAKKGGSPTAAKTIYGTVNNSNGTAAEGAMIYMSTTGGNDLSALIRAQGSWAIPLSTARNADLTGYMTFANDTKASLFVQGDKASETATVDVAIGEAQPVPPITLVSSSTTTRSATIDTPVEQQAAASPLTSTSVAAVVSSPAAVEIAAATASPAASVTPVVSASPSAVPSPLPSPAAAIASPTAQQADTVDLTSSHVTTVETSQPIITGRAAPNSIITVEVHSENAITSQVQTDAQGNFTLPLSGQTTELEPGEHTVTVTYTDPITKKQKTETKTFYVAGDGTASTSAPVASSALLALATSPSPKPYGTDNPYTIPSPSPTASASATISASPRMAMPATTSSIPKAGSVGMTYGLIFGGLFMVLAGVWAYMQSGESEEQASGE